MIKTKKALLFCALFLSIMRIQAQTSFTCTGDAAGSANCTPQYEALVKASQDTSYLEKNSDAVVKDLESLLDTNSGDYNPSLALKLGQSFLSQLQLSKTSQGALKPIQKKILELVLTILVKGSQRPGQEGASRTVQEYIDDLLSMYLLTQQFDFKALNVATQAGAVSARKQLLLDKGLPPDTKADTETKLALLDIVTRDNFTLNDIYQLYGRTFYFNKNELRSSLTGSIEARCNKKEQEEFGKLYSQVYLFLTSRIIQDLADLYEDYKGKYSFGEVYKRLADQIFELDNRRTFLTGVGEQQPNRRSYKVLNNNSMEKLIKMFGIEIPLYTNLMSAGCSGTGAGAEGNTIPFAHNLIDIHDKLVNELKVKPKVTTGVSGKENNPLDYVSPEAIKAALAYNAENYPATTLCKEMGACTIDANDSAVSIYRCEK